MSFRKKHKAKGEDMKVAHAKGSKGAATAAATAEANEEKPPTQQMPAETPAEAVSPEELEPQGGDEPVPEGTTAEILAWVGDDKGRAQAAFDKENADEKPRVGLTGELEKLLGE